MPIQINSPGWTIRRGVSRGGAQRGDSNALPGLPQEFLTDDSRVGQEETLDPPSPTRGAAVASAGLDLSYSAPPDRTAMLAIRHRSGALTFHRPVQSTTRGTRGPSEVRFQVTLPRRATRGLVGDAIKAIVIEVAKVAADTAVSFLLPKLAETAERALWKKKGLKEGWLRVTKETLASGALAAGTPVSPVRSLLFIHGTFSNAASAYHDLAASTFFDRVKEIYGDRIFAFDHFTISRTPEQNATMLLDALPDQATTFDVVTHSRGGLVLRNLVERTRQLGSRASRFKLGSAVLVASPNEGTPLATPRRWDETVGWMANLLELFPDNPFTTGAAFVANGIVWLANHASGDLPGLHSMDADGDLIDTIQGPPGPPATAYSALVANYQPTGSILTRLVDVGFDQFFASANDLVVPTEGGWRVDRTTTDFIPAARIGCFGPGGNLKQDSVTHVSFFSHSETVDFLVNALLGRQQTLDRVDPRKPLPDRRLIRGGISDAPVPTRPARAALKGEKRVAAAAPRSDAATLRITVTNGDLTFVREALLIGHYRSTRLTSTEDAMNRMLGGVMDHSLQMGVYPLSVGSSKIFINNRPDVERGILVPRPEAVIVAGLGEEGKLKAAHLVLTVRLAVIEWAQRLVEHKNRGRTPFDLATTLIGSGGPGISAGESARLIAQGVYEANALLTEEHGRDSAWPRVGHLRFIELYLDRATEAWRALRLQEETTEGRFAVDDEVIAGTGPLQRPVDTGYRGADYDFITVQTRTKEGEEPELFYSLDTRRARSEIRGQQTQSKLLQDLVTTASNDRNRDPQVGRTLFNLLIPIELEAYMAASGEIQIELDPESAPIPWEALDTDAAANVDGDPWAIRVKLLRKLRLPDMPPDVRDADADDGVLVIGEPDCPDEYPRLLGARNEALAVRTCLSGPGALEPDRVTALISDDPSERGSDAQTIVNALFERPWRIVHIAGHGMPPAKGKPGGVVLSNGNFLSASEIANVRAVPELVFVNCCYLGSGESGALQPYDRAAFASSVAGALIAIGVRCVVAAGWAVDDDSANVFAETFYASLLRGNRFVDAVVEARKAAYARSPEVNTWAAYQCYGDPDWVFRRNAPDANRITQAIDDFAGVASPNTLRLVLERIVVEVKYQGRDLGSRLDSVRRLEKKFGAKWGKRGDVAEIFAEALVETGAVESGMHWYERSVAATDGRASLKAAEQLANVRSRFAWEMVDRARRQLDELKLHEKSAGRRGKARVDARRARAEAERSLRKAVQGADRLIAQALELLARLIAIEETMERDGLVGSAYKRRALIDTAAGRKGRVQKDLREMKAHYDRARSVGARRGESPFYPASNCLAADVALNAGRDRWKGLDGKVVAIVDEVVNAKSGRADDFWSAVGKIELRQYQAMAKHDLASAYDKIEKACKDLNSRAKATRMWASVYDTACLVLPNYAARAKGKEKNAANDLLETLRVFAHPGDSSI